MTTCLNLNQLQGYLIDGENEPLRRIVESHLPACGQCRKAFDQLAATSHRVDLWLSELSLAAEEAAPLDLAAAYAKIVDRSPLYEVAEIPW